jgi:hypothetical protein
MTPRGRKRAAAWLVSAAALFAAVPDAAAGQTQPVTLAGHAERRHIHVDQFGYRPDDAKIAVLADPVIGFNAGDRYRPGAHLAVRDAASGAVVASGRPVAWDRGAIDPSSGDRGWWFDFTGVRRTGDYYIDDPATGVRSDVFRVAPDVYRPVLKAAMRMFFYNRSGQEKRPPHAAACWSDNAAYLGAHQDGEARPVERPDAAALARDVSGGWFDAGDTNKYVTFAADPVHQLLAAYRERPAIWTDDVEIPESGNGIPDILDEVRWQIEWLKRMQLADGAVLIKVGSLSFDLVSPPGSDRGRRYYGPPCSSSTIAAAGMFAHAAAVFSGVPGLKHQAADLRQRAEAAWRRYHALPKSTTCDTLEIKSGDADLSLDQQAGLAVVAAVYLFALTADPAYDAYIAANHGATQPFGDAGWNAYRPIEAEALLFYAALANADRRRQAVIAERLAGRARADADGYGFSPDRDLYRSFLPGPAYHWGSNRVRAQVGNNNLSVMHYQLLRDRDDALRTRAQGDLHYLHGVNPLGIVYLSNMGAFGAEHSANEIFHAWFADGTMFDNALASPCGPAPGYLTGGPNAAYSGTLSPPKGQPPQKAYRDWNTGWPENAWEITEPSISYQAAYVKLLSKFVD